MPYRLWKFAYSDKASGHTLQSKMNEYIETVYVSDPFISDFQFASLIHLNSESYNYMKLQSDIGHFQGIWGTFPSKNRYVLPYCPNDDEPVRQTRTTSTHARTHAIKRRGST